MKTTVIKIFAFILAAAMCASFAGCSKSEPEKESGDNAGISNSPMVNVADGDDEGGAGESDDGQDIGTTGSEEDTENAEESTAPEGDSAETEESAAPEEETSAGEEDGDAPENNGETETAVITTEQQPVPSDKGEAIAQTALSAVGYDFLFGGESPEEGGFDNSGLIYYALTQNGISCPRTTNEMLGIGTEIGYDELSSGDPVFFKMNDGSDIVFGGIYIGDGQAVMSLSEDIPVKIVDVATNYYKDVFLCGIRVI